jgi:hypothetical protein
LTNALDDWMDKVSEKPYSRRREIHETQSDIDDWLNDAAEDIDDLEIELKPEDEEYVNNRCLNHVDVAWVGDYEIVWNARRKVFIATCSHCGKTFASKKDKYGRTESARHLVQTHILRNCAPEPKKRVQPVDCPF